MINYFSSHPAVVGVALGGDMAMYSDEPSVAAVGLAFDTSEEY